MKTTRREINEFIAIFAMTILVLVIVNAGVMALLTMGVPPVMCMILSLLVQLGLHRLFGRQINAAVDAVADTLQASQDFVIRGITAAGNWVKGLFGNNNLSAA